VVLAGVRNPLNIGAAARAMSNFGFFDLRLVNHYQMAFRRARSAVGAADLLEKAREFDDLGEALSDCSLVVGTTAAGRRELQHPLRSLPRSTAALQQKMRTGRVALLFGSEKYGLSNQQLSYCNWLIRIPTRAEHGSMNLGQAVAICLYELIRGRKSSVAKKADPVAGAGELERITRMLMEVLQQSGYVTRYQDSSTEEKIRRLVRRLRLPAQDADTWMGILRQIAWKTRQTK
jgi:TrmH family RNA methyltransferase